MELLKIALPIIWVIVATAVGLTLYRTSSALFEKVSDNQSTRNRLKLTGSIVIAAVTFFGMYYVTPKEALNPTPSGEVYVSKIEVQRLADRVGEVQDGLLLLAGCESIDSIGACSEELQAVQSSVESLAQQVNKVSDISDD